LDKATQDVVRQELSGQSIIVFSTLNSDQNSIKTLSDFAQQTDLASYTVLSTDSSSSVALEARYHSHPSIMEIRTKANQAQIDVNIISGHIRRKKRLLLADMDATIIRDESLDELADLAGIADKIIPITKRAMAGELDFQEALSARLSFLNGQPETLLHQVVKNTQITNGAHELVGTMRAHGAHCYLISGGFTDHHSNIIGISNGMLTGKVVPPILDQQAKLRFLEHYIKKFNLKPDDCLCVGDGANDMAMLQHAGMGVAFQGKPTLREKIELQLNHTDLTGLLYLQGYHSAEFSTS
jgi:phosphoserine phosphatase